MSAFKILCHGTFAPADSGTAAKLPLGFYTSRVVVASDREAALVRVNELIRSELEETLLKDSPTTLVSLEAEEIQEIELEEGTVLNRRGFTFYGE
jgi:hypothetical protein